MPLYTECFKDMVLQKTLLQRRNYKRKDELNIGDVEVTKFGIERSSEMHDSYYKL